MLYNYVRELNVRELKMNNISDGLGHSPCTGCGACVTICPVSAIDYELNENGFFEATANDNLCINCEKCKKVCLKYLVKDDIGNKIQDGELFAARSTDINIVKSCTSGGIAYEIAKFGFKYDYIVVGVVYNYKNNIAETIIANSFEDIEKFKGSKYIQSNTIPCFKEIIKLAKKQKEAKFIIFGTPCQITGIRKVFEINNLNNQVILIDLFCHGVPSYNLWNKYLHWLKVRHKIDKITRINFRSKSIGWHDFTMEIQSEDSIYSHSSEYDMFYKAFFDNILLNTACRKCVVRKEVSSADIRLGDFWGKTYQYDQDGISAVLIMSEQGKSLLKRLVNEKLVKVIKQHPVEECISNQSIHDYMFDEVHYKGLSLLRSSKNIKYIITNYRKCLPIKYRIRVYLKEMTAYLPDSVRSKLRLWYRNR